MADLNWMFKMFGLLKCCLCLAYSETKLPACMTSFSRMRCVCGAPSLHWYTIESAQNKASQFILCACV